MEKTTVNKKDWSRYIGRGEGTESLAACIDSLFKQKSGSEWDQNTTKKYISLFEEKILPLVSVANTKRIRDYTQDDIEEAVYKIKMLINPRDHQEYDSVDVHLRLLRFAIETGIENGWCDESLLYGTSLIHETEKKTVSQKRNANRLRKSLTPTEEVTLFNYLTKSIYAAGEIIGLLLMLIFGLRNCETCPLTWNKIQPLETNPNIHVLYIVESSKKKSKEVKDSGKTKNFPRIIPIPKAIYEFLMKRKSWIKAYIEEHYDEIVARDRKLKKFGIDKYIGRLRIVCHGNDVFGKTRPDDLSAAGRKVLSQVLKFDSHSYYLLNEYLKLPENCKKIRDFRDPTSYLLRHNFATFLLAATASSLNIIQYLMGHVIEDRTAHRYDYSNADRQNELYLIMERRPLLAYEAEKKPAKCEAPYSAEKISGTQEYIISRKSGKTIEIELQALEPNDAIDITLCCRSEVKITKKVFSTDYHNPNLAENLENQYRVYRMTKAQLKKG